MLKMLFLLIPFHLFHRANLYDPEARGEGSIEYPIIFCHLEAEATGKEENRS